MTGNGKKVVSVRPLILTSLTFAAAGMCFLCWAVSLGGIPFRSVEAPIQLVDGATSTFGFSLIESSSHYVGIEVANASGDMRDELLQLSGSARLMAGEQLLTQTDLPSPVRHTSGNAEVIVLEFTSSSLSPYTLIIKLNKVPELLTGRKGVVKVELSSFEIEGAGLILCTGILCLTFGTGFALAAARRKRRTRAV